MEQKIKHVEQTRQALQIQQLQTTRQEVFRNNFSDKLNANPHLVAFINCVRDFMNDCFRDGKPEDFLTECVPIEHKDYGSIDHQDVVEVKSFRTTKYANTTIGSVSCLSAEIRTGLFRY